jgi:hypothetical protein
VTVPPTSGPEPSPTPEERPGGDSPPQAELPRWARPSPANQLLSEERLAAYFGAKWEKVYRRKLAPFLDDPAFTPTWNWSAALASPAWFLYRKLYLPFSVFFLVPGFVFRWLTGSDTPQTATELMKPENEWLLSMSMAVYVSSMLAAGGTANWFLFRRARAASRFVSMQELPAGEDTALMRRMGGVNRLATALFVSLMVVLSLAQIGG